MRIAFGLRDLGIFCGIQSQLWPPYSAREAWVQRWRRHVGLRIEIDPALTETVQGHRWLVHQLRRHQLDAIRADPLAAGALDKLTLARQGLSVFGIEDRGEFPFDLAGLAGHLGVHLHREVPLRIWDRYNSHRGDIPMIYE